MVNHLKTRRPGPQITHWASASVLHFRVCNQGGGEKRAPLSEDALVAEEVEDALRGLGEGTAQGFLGFLMGFF